MTSPEWQERSLEAATTRVRLAQERTDAANAQREDDATANAAGDPGGYGRAPETAPKSRKKTADA